MTGPGGVAAAVHFKLHLQPRRANGCAPALSSDPQIEAVVIHTRRLGRIPSHSCHGEDIGSAELFLLCVQVHQGTLPAIRSASLTYSLPEMSLGSSVSRRRRSSTTCPKSARSATSSPGAISGPCFTVQPRLSRQGRLLLRLWIRRTVCWSWGNA